MISAVSSSVLQKASLTLQSLLGFLPVQLSNVFGNVYKFTIASELVDVYGGLRLFLYLYHPSVF